MTIRNEQLQHYRFLAEMLEDKYFPANLVEKGQQILVRMCERIEAESPADLAALYQITQLSTEEFNRLGEEFEENGSEIETAARECIGADFEFVAKAYGFAAADIEELISTREW